MSFWTFTRLMAALRSRRLLRKMRQDWDERARRNAEHYVQTEKREWTDEEFFASGRQEVEEDVLADMAEICQGRDPKQMRILEIGCGAGRMTRWLAEIFGEVHAVDVSGEMIRRAQEKLVGLTNVHLCRNSGTDLSVLPPGPYDFAISVIVFQHIPSREVVERYIREVHRVLAPGALFKFQVQGVPDPNRAPDDTWEGVGFSPQDMRDIAARSGFELRREEGAGTQYYFVWFFKT